MFEQSNKNKVLKTFLVFMVFATVSIFNNQNLRDYGASVISSQSHAPFDGTTNPIQYVPDWVKLTAEEKDLSYSELPGKLIPLPFYDENKARTPTESLIWGNADHDVIRNLKITYPVLYMGNYKLDHGSGSHLAVDIKIPIGTPIYSIMNGYVSKVSNLDVGFGKHIVVQSNDVPSLDDANVKTTYFVSYSHLSSTLVKEGDLVTKGQQIALSGETGEATTPHLHFQIDREESPWNPYWPFTYSETQAAGISFSEAVNVGFNKDKALAMTISPFLYIQKYFDNTTVLTSFLHGSAETVVTNPTVSVVEEIPTPVPEIKREVVALKLITDGSFIVGVPEIITIQAIDKDGVIVLDYDPGSNGVSVSLAAGGAEIKTTFLRTEDFVEGVAQVTVVPNADRGLLIEAVGTQIKGQSDIMQNILFSDVDPSSNIHKYVSFLKEYRVINGYSDGTFGSGNVVIRAEAAKFLLEGINEKLQSDTSKYFPDFDKTAWYNDYVATAINKKIFQGFPDGTLKLEKTVNRAEFYKMLTIALGGRTKIVKENVFNDVNRRDWHAKYIQFAKQANLIGSTMVVNNKFDPNAGMARAEVGEVIYKAIIMKLNNATAYNENLNVSSIAASEFFAS